MFDVDVKCVGSNFRPMPYSADEIQTLYQHQHTSFLPNTFYFTFHSLRYLLATNLFKLFNSQPNYKMSMKYTYLGSSGLKVSRICVGCMSFGDRRGRYPWCVEEKDALPILEACYNAGINFFDTANGYSNGVSEIILGKRSRNTIFPVKTSLSQLNCGHRLVTSKTASSIMRWR